MYKPTRHQIVLLLLIISALVIQIFIAAVFIRQSGYDITKTHTWNLAQQPNLPSNAAYSPIPILIARGWQSIFSASLTSALIYKLLLFLCSLALLYRLSQMIISDRWVGYVTLVLTMFSPYLVWSFNIGRDVDLDVLAVALSMYFAYRALEDNRRRAWAAVGLSSALAVSVRESNLVLLPALLILFFLAGKISLRKSLQILVVFILGLIPLIAWNWTQVGSPVLSTRFGVNLYIGNHPHYLDGHPRYDIDVFLADSIEAERHADFEGDPNPIEINAFWRDKAVEQILEDPLAFVHRMALKSFWWVGLQRIPGSDLNARLRPTENAIDIRGSTSEVKELIYIAHRAVVFLGIFLALKFRTIKPATKLFLILPILAALPIVLLTFPDTRFRLAYDPYTYILSATGFVSWLRAKRTEAKDTAR